MRFWEIDAARGTAVLLMIVSNFIYDLFLFGIMNIDITSGLFFWFPRAVAGTFIFLAGLSFSISYAKNKRVSHHLKRGGKIFGCGIAITLVTLFTNGTIWFGILHFIGLAIVLSLLFVKFDRALILLSGIFIMLGAYIQSVSFSFSWLLWLGFIPQGFYTYDYFPVLPWLGVMLLGVYFGKWFYKNGKRSFKIKERKLSFLWIGRHSLTVYLIHQPAIFAVLYLLGYGLVL